jgi:hypothetical protein
VEAFQRGLPVLCSDIPVFREVADGKAVFFGLESAGQLFDTISGQMRASQLRELKAGE